MDESYGEVESREGLVSSSELDILPVVNYNTFDNKDNGDDVSEEFIAESSRWIFSIKDSLLN